MLAMTDLPLDWGDGATSECHHQQRLLAPHAYDLSAITP
jgi:hypothetical protein